MIFQLLASQNTSQKRKKGWTTLETAWLSRFESGKPVPSSDPSSSSFHTAAASWGARQHLLGGGNDPWCLWDAGLQLSNLRIWCIVTGYHWLSPPEIGCFEQTLYPVLLFRHNLPVAGHEQVSASEQARFLILREAIFWISSFIDKLQSVCQAALGLSRKFRYWASFNRPFFGKTRELSGWTTGKASILDSRTILR